MPSLPSGRRLWPALAGGAAALALLKLGNPPILPADPPGTLLEWIFFQWPPVLGLVLVALLILAALPGLRRPSGVPGILLCLPALWYGWVCLSAFGTVDPQLTRIVLLHFGALVALFYLGCLRLSRARSLEGFRLPLLLGFCLVLHAGFGQRLGGLEETRRMIESRLGEPELPPGERERLEGILERAGKERIFSTLFYPNSLAGGILLLGPLCAAILWRLSGFLRIPSRLLLCALLASASCACLYWTQSKSAWLAALALAALFLLRLPMAPWARRTLPVLALAAGLGGFLWKYSDYFREGATSVAARLHYWSAAGAAAWENPLTGTGPGTFHRTYSRLRPEEAEHARLAHNDYLQQASDSGLPAALLYLAWIGASLWRLRPPRPDPLQEALWYGMAAFALQNLAEFFLYVPALSGTFFLLLGWALGQGSPGAARPLPGRAPPP